MMTEYPSVSIIILNYNSLAHLQANLDSLLLLDYPAARVELILADNDSTDGSVAWVAKNYPVVRIVKNGANLGFAAGNNAGVAAAKGDWVVILNPDMRVEVNWLKELLRPLQQNPYITSVASRILNWDGTALDFGDAAINFMGWGCQPGYGSRDIAAFGQDKPLLFPCGGAMLIKRAVFLDIGGFDSDFFAYYEDVDLGWRLWMAGYEVMYAANAIVYHRHHGSWQHVPDARKWVLSERNTLFTIIKNYADESLAWTLPAVLLLLNTRAYLDINPDPKLFDLPTLPINTGAEPIGYGPGYYWSQVKQSLQNGGLSQLWRRTRDEIGRRWRGRQEITAVPSTQALNKPIDGHFPVSTNALGRLLAARDVRRAWPDLMQKRAVVQAQRQRPDSEIFQLFQWALVSNFGDPQFIRTMEFVIKRFGLTDLFAENGQKQVTITPQMQTVSRQCALRLLELLDFAFTLSAADEIAFRLGETELWPQHVIPQASVAVLVKIQHILHTLPQKPLAELLPWLHAQLQQIEIESHV